MKQRGAVDGAASGPEFPGEIAGASLKRHPYDDVVVGLREIPRRNRRGLIEAQCDPAYPLVAARNSPAKSPGPH